ncbi:MAG: hypothetical protein H7Y00_07925 [Fimbriimonadaceae bacterium]|nr:hypothetical protein [Chitinophagales bacterium]
MIISKKLSTYLLASGLCMQVFSQISKNGNDWTLNIPQAVKRNCIAGEYYSLMWVKENGSFVKQNTTCSNQLVLQNYTGSNVSCFSINRYGDDEDDAIVVHGGSGSNSNINYYNENDEVPNQNVLTSGQHLLIQTSHGTNLVQIGDDFFVVITIGDDVNDSTAQYDVVLQYDNTKLQYIQAVNDQTGYTPNTPPSINRMKPNENNTFCYHSFANIQTGGPNQLKWTINNSLYNNKEKNIYIAFKVTGQGNITPLLATVTGSTNDGTVTNSYNSSFNLTGGAAYDPNVISVDKTESTMCGRGGGEWLEYTIHFQNIGAAPANTVEVNLDLDNNLDVSSLQLLNSEAGTTFFTNSVSKILFTGYATTNTVNNTRGNTGKFSWWETFSNANYLRTNCNAYVDVNNNNISGGRRMRDICFVFDNINLRGIEESGVTANETKGFITFKIKTLNPYSTLHSQAGIIFNCNEEIITNLAETVCISDADNCEDELTNCQQQLKNCGNEHRGNNPWLCWLGWIIAGFLFILLLVMRNKRKQNS